MDITNPMNLRLIGFYQTLGSAFSVAIQGNMLYVGGSVAMQIFDISQWQMVIYPLSADVGNYNIRVTATDELGGSVFSSFTIRVEGPPQLHGNFPTQYAKGGTALSLLCSRWIFYRSEFDPIIFSAILSNGQILPGWLAFNSISAAFAGTPFSQDVGKFLTYQTISATDNIAGAVNTTFQLFVDYLPVLNQPLPDCQVAGVNILYQWSLPANTFFDPAGDLLTLIAQLSNSLIVTVLVVIQYD